jgi:hypothetical protein
MPPLSGFHAFCALAIGLLALIQPRVFHVFMHPLVKREGCESMDNIASTIIRLYGALILSQALLVWQTRQVQRCFHLSRPLSPGRAQAARARASRRTRQPRTPRAGPGSVCAQDFRAGVLHVLFTFICCLGVRSPPCTPTGRRMPVRRARDTRRCADAFWSSSCF